MLTVTDSGPGMPEAFIPVALDRFTRADDARTGQSGGGLGLAIVQALAGSAGGTVTLANRPEGGLVVTVRLPLSQAERRRSRRRTRTGPCDRTRPPHRRRRQDPAETRAHDGAVGCPARPAARPAIRVAAVRSAEAPHRRSRGGGRPSWPGRASLPFAPSPIGSVSPRTRSPGPTENWSRRECCETRGRAGTFVAAGDPVHRLAAAAAAEFAERADALGLAREDALALVAAALDARRQR